MEEATSLMLEVSRLSWITFSVGIISMEIEGEDCTRLFYFTLKSATKPLNVLIAFTPNRSLEIFFCAKSQIIAGSAIVIASVY